MSLADLDALVGELPPPARAQRTWWGNSSNSQALAWREAGFHVGTVSLERERVWLETRSHWRHLGTTSR